MRGQVWLALMYNDGQLPGTALCNAKAVMKWCREHDPDNVGSTMAIWEKLSAELQSHLGNGADPLSRDAGQIRNLQRQAVRNLQLQSMTCGGRSPSELKTFCTEGMAGCRSISSMPSCADQFPGDPLK